MPKPKTCTLFCLVDIKKRSFCTYCVFWFELNLTDLLGQNRWAEWSVVALVSNLLSTFLLLSYSCSFCYCPDLQIFYLTILHFDIPMHFCNFLFLYMHHVVFIAQLLSNGNSHCYSIAEAIWKQETTVPMWHSRKWSITFESFCYSYAPYRMHLLWMTHSWFWLWPFYFEISHWNRWWFQWPSTQPSTCMGLS